MENETINTSEVDKKTKGLPERALDGVTVLEYCSMVSGPYCTKTMADLGAEVIKIEPPVDGDLARRVFLQVEHPTIGDDWVIAPPWRLSETPAQINRHAPLLGEHNEYVFGELLGMSSVEIKRLEKEKVIY